MMYKEHGSLWMAACELLCLETTLFHDLAIPTAVSPPHPHQKKKNEIVISFCATFDKIKNLQEGNVVSFLEKWDQYFYHLKNFLT